MPQFIVIQEPKAKYRNTCCTTAMVLEAPSAAAAVRSAIQVGDRDAEKWFGPSGEYRKPYAQPVMLGKTYRF